MSSRRRRQFISNASSLRNSSLRSVHVAAAAHSIMQKTRASYTNAKRNLSHQFNSNQRESPLAIFENLILREGQVDFHDVASVGFP